MTIPRHCPRCYRLEDEIGQCGDFALGCPLPVDTHETKDVVIRCAACDKTRAVPVADLMKGVPPGRLGQCHRDVCQAVVIQFVSAPAKPARKEEAEGEDVADTRRPRGAR